jgi:hypothetical protein
MLRTYCKKGSLVRGEVRRLTGSKGDGAWNLTTGTIQGRTRGLGNGRPVLQVIDSTDEEDAIEIRSEAVESEDTRATAEEEKNDDDEEATKKPMNNRILLEIDQLDHVIGQLACRLCGESVKATVKSVCIASSIGIECMNEECGFLFHPQAPAGTTIHLARNDNFERSTDYAINVLYVLSFMAMGDGCTEAARLLGLLGLPNDTTMKGRSFSIIQEERVGPFVRALGEEVVLENLIEEARLSMEAAGQDEHDFKIWKDSLTDKSIKLSLARMPKIHGSYDMAWQQKGSGHQYNSLSGHGSLVGRRTRKVVGLIVKSKTCNACNLWKRKHPNVPIIAHNCYKNHDGTSGSMESAGLLQLVVDTFDKYQAVIELLCCDDDSSIRADLQWSNKDYMMNNRTDQLPMVKKKVGKNKGELHPRPDKGKLPSHIPEPTFVADPNHRRKGLTGELIKLDMGKVQEKFTMTRMDSTRLGKNFGYMARTLKGRPQSESIPAAEAVLEHHFDVHDNCHSSWCPRMSETEEERKASTKFYRCKTKAAKLYAVLSEKLSRFVTMDKLQEMAHDMDTNMNEGFNNICTWFLPKNKVFAGCGSLNNRISFAVCINSIGVLPFLHKTLSQDGHHHDGECEASPSNERGCKDEEDRTWEDQVSQKALQQGKVREAQGAYSYGENGVPQESWCVP